MDESTDKIKDFRGGWNNFQQSGSALGEALSSNNYVDSVNSAVDEFQNNIDKFCGKLTEADKLKGNIAEFWHSESFNVNAALNQSSFHTHVEESTGFASVDISTNWGEFIGSKYYKTGSATAHAQSIDYWEYFHKYHYDQKMDFSTFLESNGVSPEEGMKHISIYFGQQRLVPSDQVEEIRKWLQIQIDKNANNQLNPDRAALVAKFKETLDNIKTKIEAPDGTCSYELSKDDAQKFAQLAKEGKLDLRENGFAIEDLMTFDYVMKESIKSGVNAAMLSFVLKVGPEIFKCIHQLIKEGKLDPDQLKNTGIAALEGAGNGFLTGFTSSAVMTACKSGVFGSAMKSVSPGLVSSAVVLVLGTMKDAVLVSMGKMDQREMANNLTRILFVTGCSVGFGMLFQMIPVPGLYLLGNFVGSMVGTFVYGKLDNFAMSFCVESGYTFFGLVEQDYQVPDSVLEEIGIDVYKIDIFQPDIYVIDEYKIDEYQIDEYKLDKIWFSVLRRGVIGVHKVGYIFD